MAKLLGICSGCMIIVALYAAFGFVFAWCLEWIWNILAPALWHGPRIDFWTAYALYCFLSLIGCLIRNSQGKA